MFRTNLCTILLFVCVALLSTVENKSFFGIGGRIIGDQLLSKDILTARSGGIDEAPTMRFNYKIPEPITYIEIVSEEKVLAVVNFSYHENLVAGTVASVNVTTDDDARESFEVQISIFGFNHTILNVSPALIINKDQEFAGILQPRDDDVENFAEEYRNLTQSDEAADIDENVHEELLEKNDEEDGYDYEDSSETDFIDGDFGHADKIIAIGHRQDGDYLVHESFQTSLTTTADPTTHSVVFYYIDDHFITSVKFIVFNPLLWTDETSAEQQLESLYSHISPTSLKAIITDYKTTSLFVHMLVFGFGPKHVPVDYEPFLPPQIPSCTVPYNNIKVQPTERPMSPMQRLKLMMNAVHSDNENNHEGLTEAATEVSTEATSSQENMKCGSGVASLSFAEWNALNTISYLAIVMFFI